MSESKQPNKNSLHPHNDKKIKSCAICQKNIKEIIKAGKELDKMGIWNIPKKIQSGIEYNIWIKKRNKE